MAKEADKLHGELQRYRALLRSTLDKKTSEALRQMITEIEARLKELGDSNRPAS